MPESHGNWSPAEVGGHAVHVYEPPEPSEHGYTVIYLHGAAQGLLSDHAPFCRELDRHGLRAVAPMTGESWWADRVSPAFDPAITAERHVLDRVVPFVAERFGAEPPRIALLGTSMGGQGALRLAFKYPSKFPVVAAISPAIDFYIRWQEGDPVLRAMYADAEAARQDTATLHVHPLSWVRHLWFCCDPTDTQWYESSDRLRMKLGSMGIPFESDLETEAGGHGFTYYNAMAERAIGFIANGLERERLRIV